MQQYVDHDPSPKASDFSCSFLTYDGHKGTDFGLRDPALLDRGVFVVAAAAGRVVARRDGVIDKIYTAEDAERVDKIECGNGVVIQHDDGWQTQYCHMKQGSVNVTKGQIVAQGDPWANLAFLARLHSHICTCRFDRGTAWSIPMPPTAG